MESNKQKHLQFIQTTICRMSGNLFFLKGWTVTLVAALFALAAKDSRPEFMLIGLLMVIVFWILDGYFLSQERKFRDLYNEVRKKKEEDIDFSMNTKEYEKFAENRPLNAMTSTTLLWFYLPLILVILIVPNLEKIKNLCQ